MIPCLFVSFLHLPFSLFSLSLSLSLHLCSLLFCIAIREGYHVLMEPSCHYVVVVDAVLFFFSLTHMQLCKHICSHGQSVILHLYSMQPAIPTFTLIGRNYPWTEASLIIRYQKLILFFLQKKSNSPAPIDRFTMRKMLIIIQSPGIPYSSRAAPLSCIICTGAGLISTYRLPLKVCGRPGWAGLAWGRGGVYWADSTHDRMVT